MGLHDIDKDHYKRMKPSPNGADQLPVRPAHGTTQNHNAGESALEDGLKMKERQILAVQDGVNKAVFGFYGAANKFGFKIAQDGVDVLTATDDQLLVNSEQNVFKIVKVVEASYVLTATDVTNTYFFIDVPHGLGFKPTVIGSFYRANDGQSRPLPCVFTTNISYAGAPPSAVLTITSIDDTEIHLRGTMHDTAGLALFTVGSMEFKLYCLQETII